MRFKAYMNNKLAHILRVHIALVSIPIQFNWLLVTRISGYICFVGYIPGKVHYTLL